MFTPAVSKYTAKQVQLHKITVFVKIVQLKKNDA